MCSRYNPPRQDVFYEEFKAMPPENLPVGPIFPRTAGVIVRANEELEREAVVAHWGLVPSFAKAMPLKFSTNNARAESLATAATFRDAWARGQRCIIPAESFDESNWESGRNVWWRFRRADRRPWGLAGLWNTWLDRERGVFVETYTMLTMNADAHPLMRRMNKPDPKLPPDQQDKRSVVAIAPADRDVWLRGSQAAAGALMRLAPVEDFDAAPEDDRSGTRSLFD